MSRVTCWLLGLTLLSLATPTLAATRTLVVKGGLSLASVTDGFEFVDPQSKQGFTGAVAMELPLASRVSIAPELGYAMRGMSLGESEIVVFTGTGGTVESVQATEYLTIGVPFSLAIPTGGIGFSLSTGPQLAIKTAERLVLRGAIDESVNTSGFTSSDAGWLFGAGADVALGPGRVGFEARYVLGLTNLNDFGAEDFKNRTFEILATWKHPLGQ
jgi:hypothetical protein